MTKRELKQALARRLCILGGYDPDGTDAELMPEEADERWRNWQAFLPDACEAITMVSECLARAAERRIGDQMVGRLNDGQSIQIVFERERTSSEIIHLLRSYIPQPGAEM